MTPLKVLIRTIRTALWFRPTVWSLVAAFFVIAVAGLDQMIPVGSPAARAVVEPDAVQDLLRLMAGGMLTVTTVSLSMTMVVLNLVANQASPRAVPELLADPVTQNALSAFLATFVFALAALAGFGCGALAPAGANLIFLAAVALGLWAIRYMVQWMHHVANSSKLNEIIAKVYDQADKSLADYLARGNEEAAQFPDRDPAEAIRLNATRTGYVQLIDVARLRDLAGDRDLDIRLHVREGDFVHPNLPVMTVWGSAAEEGRWEDDPRACVVVGRERTPEGDPCLGIELLTEIACRALSPGVNDPQSALVSLDHLGALLSRAAAVPADRYPPTTIKGGRLELQSVDFTLLLFRALRPVSRDGAAQTEVARRILEILLHLASIAAADHLAVIRRETARAAELACAAQALAEDKAGLEGLSLQVDALCARRSATPAPA